VLHVGGVYGDRLVARERFVRQVETLTPQVRSRLALENDDHRFSVDDCLWIHRQTGVPLTFDYLHFRCHNPDGMTLREALTSCLATWPMGARPKMHFSSPRTSAVVIEHHDATGDRVRRRTRPPRTTQHADYVDPFTFIDLMRAAWSAELKEFDVMLEAKAQDLALLQLREDVARLAPEWVPHLA